MRVAAIQMSSTPDKARNLETAERLVTEAAKEGAVLVVLPEMFCQLGSPEVLKAGAEPLQGPSMKWAKSLSQKLSIWLVAGSFMEIVKDQEKHFNTSCLFDPHGEVQGIYRKIHLFDCEMPGSVFRESNRLMPGRKIAITQVEGLPMGLAICYDLRFPELFRIQTFRGACAVALPSAFMEKTGEAHWEVLVRSRAIENQIFMIAANQIGGPPEGPHCWGHSMIVDPWGRILAQAEGGEVAVLAELDGVEQDRIRQMLPCLDHAQPEVYGT